MPKIQLNVAAAVPSGAVNAEPKWFLGANGRWQCAYVDADGNCEPFGEMEDAGGANQFQRLNYPTGPVSVDETGKIRISGMVNQ